MKTTIAILVTALFFNPSLTVEKWVIEKNSYLNIQGKSNVNTFRCDVKQYLHADTILLYKDGWPREQFPVKGGLIIQLNQFDCHQKHMTSDLRKTLKADRSPYMKIDLLSIGDLTPSAGKNIKGTLTIELAGVKRKIEVNYTVQQAQGTYLHVQGTCQVLFSDFGLTPPEKLAGLIKVAQQIDVRFLLVMRCVTN
jgi:hypothetical protein